MPYNPNIHHRRSIRLKGYDYSQKGAYFITLCVKDRECIFGAFNDGIMELNCFGEIVRDTWKDLPNHNADIVLDQYIIMPNHFHGIIIITDLAGADTIFPDSDLEGFVRAGSEPAPTDKNIPAPAKSLKRQELPELVRQLKTFSARRINESRCTPGLPLWQRGYYEHIIRDEPELNRIREYIINNPSNLQNDAEKK